MSVIVDRIVAHLAEVGRATSSAIVDALDVRRNTVQIYLSRLRHGTPKRVRVADWTKDGKPLPIYELGDAPDKPAPAPKTLRQIRAKRWRTKDKHDAELALRQRIHRAAYEARKNRPQRRATPPPQSWLSALLPK